jgi:hypothetical protein
MRARLSTEQLSANQIGYLLGRPYATAAGGERVIAVLRAHAALWVDGSNRRL